MPAVHAFSLTLTLRVPTPAGATTPLKLILPPELEFGYIGRPERASPGEGYPAAHTVEQNRIIRTALDLDIPVSVNPKKQPGER